MGIFSSKKTVQVSSTVYNLAGEEENRTNYLKSTVFSSTIGDAKASLGEAITSSYLNGPGLTQRHFFKWAKDNNFVGLPDSGVVNLSQIDPVVIAAEIAVDPGLSVNIQSATIVSKQFHPFAEKYILANKPEKFNEAWTVDYDADVHELIITYLDATTDYVDAGDYDPDGEYIVAYYYAYEPIIESSFTVLSSDTDEVVFANVPDSSTYSFIETVDGTTDTFDLDETVTEERTYSDSTPSTTTTTVTTTSEDYTDQVSTYEIVTYTGSSGTSVTTTSDRELYTITEKRYITETTTTTTTTNDLGGGVTETVTTTTVTEALSPIWDWEKKDQTISEHVSDDGYQIFIYKVGGSNTVLNALRAETPNPSVEYYPFIPLRIDNKPVDHQDYIDNGLYSASSKAYRKAFKKNEFSKLLSNIEDNDDIGDVDYVYLTFGVPLNTKDNEAKAYMFKYFDYIKGLQITTPSEIANLESTRDSYESSLVAYKSWITAQGDHTDPLYNTTRTSLPSMSIPQLTSVNQKTDSPLINNYDIRLSWYSIEKTTGTGLGKVGAVKDDYWFEEENTIDISYNKAETVLASDPLSESREYINIEVVSFYHQIDNSNYEKLTIYGLKHENFIYGNKSVVITAKEALNDSEESGLLIPLHEPTLSTLSLVEATQLSVSNNFLVFNSYTIVKQKWYTNAFFKFLLLVVTIVIAIYSFGAGSALTAGLLGTNLAVGTAVGLTGAAAVAAGAAINALAAIALSQILQYGGRALFGDEIGAIVGAIASFVITAGIGPNGFDLMNLVTPENLLKLSGVLSNSYSDFVENQIMEMSEEVVGLQDEIKEQADYIKTMMLQLGGMNDLSFNPLALTDINNGNDSSFQNYLPETSDEFIHRTTLVGSDVVDVTLSMVSDYTDLSLILPKN